MSLTERTRVMVKVERPGKLGDGITNHRKCSDGDYCQGPGCKIERGSRRKIVAGMIAEAPRDEL